MPVSVRPFSGSKKSSPDIGELDFAFAKASGIISKSFVGKRVSALGKLHSLSELDRLVFSGTPEASQGRELLQQELLLNLEQRILRRTTRHILNILRAFSDPPPLLILQLRACEYADLKSCLHHISAGKSMPVISDIGRFGTIRFQAYPDLAAMLGGTEFEFILKSDLSAMKSPGFDFTPLEAELDLRYYRLLVRSLSGLPSEDRIYAQQILADEISLRNCVWALRLRTYFRKKPDEVEQYLMNQKMPLPSPVIPGRVHPRFTDPGEEVSLAAEAFQMLYFSLDNRSDWKGWRWASMLNPEKPGGGWNADPRYFQNAASRYIYRLSLRCFRQACFSVSSAFCYIKLKQFEEDMLTSVTEGLGMGMPSNEVFDLIEVPA